MGKRIHVYGLARSTEPKHKRSDQSVFGAEIIVLSEPAGETIGILGFSNTVTPDELAALVGQDVHVIADVEANSGSAGGSFLNLTLIQIEPWIRPGSVPAPAAAVPAAAPAEAALV